MACVQKVGRNSLYKLEKKARGLEKGPPPGGKKVRGSGRGKGVEQTGVT